jgi:hypothetical protein
MVAACGAREPDHPASRPGAPPNSGRQAGRKSLLGIESGESAFGGQSSTLKYSHESGESGSCESRTGENPVAENSVLDEALGQLNAETTKH